MNCSISQFIFGIQNFENFQPISEIQNIKIDLAD